jgi:hypothetical protein
MRKKLLLLILALAATAGLGLFSDRPAEAACKKICCPGDPPHCVLCCSSPCPEIFCGP